MLNNMAGGAAVEESFDRHAALNLRVLDLKDNLFGKSVENLTPSEAQQIRTPADRRGLKAYTLSTVLFGGDIEQGEQAFRATNLPALQNVLDIAPILEPVQIRLLMASSSKRENIRDSTRYLQDCCPWVFDCYREAIDRIHERGCAAVIETRSENVCSRNLRKSQGSFCVLTAPTEFR